MLVCFGGAGFAEELVAEAGRDDTIALVDSAQLYQGGDARSGRLD